MFVDRVVHYTSILPRYCMFYIAVTLSLINCMSAKAATKILVLVTSLKVIALGIIVIGGIFNLWHGSLILTQFGLLEMCLLKNICNWNCTMAYCVWFIITGEM